jgi:hypothetical protein
LKDYVARYNESKYPPAIYEQLIKGIRKSLNGLGRKRSECHVVEVWPFWQSDHSHTSQQAGRRQMKIGSSAHSVQVTEARRPGKEEHATAIG